MWSEVPANASVPVRSQMPNRSARRRTLVACCMMRESRKGGLLRSGSTPRRRMCGAVSLTNLRHIVTSFVIMALSHLNSRDALIVSAA